MRNPKSEGYLRPREIDIVRLLAQGYNPKQIAHELGVKTGGIHAQIYNANKRLGTTQYTLIYKAHRMGIVI